MYAKYSLIIPHYNIPYLLRRLLETVPHREDLQVIVVDDCSTKNIEDLEQLKKDYDWIEWYSTETNGGGGKARNIGLDNAKGEYIFFADADDIFDRHLNDILNSNPTEDLIIYNAQGIYDDTGLKSTRVEHVNNFIQLYKHDAIKGELYLRYLFGEPWCKLIKRSLIVDKNIRFETSSIHNDTLFSYMIGFYASSIAVNNDILYYVIDRNDSVSKKINWNNLKIRTEIFARKNRFLKESNIPIFDDLILTPLIIYIKSGNIKKISEYFRILDRENISPVLILTKLISKSIKRILKHEI